MTTTHSSPDSSQHFLVVEPDPLFRLLLCVALSGHFSDFHAVATFSEARALLAEQTFSAIIAEYHLPGGTGLSLYEEVRRQQSDLPFILMCGCSRVTLSDPRFRFFAKPFGLAELGETLAAMLPRRAYEGSASVSDALRHYSATAMRMAVTTPSAPAGSVR